MLLFLCQQKIWSLRPCGICYTQLDTTIPWPSTGKLPYCSDMMYQVESDIALSLQDRSRSAKAISPTVSKMCDLQSISRLRTSEERPNGRATRMIVIAQCYQSKTSSTCQFNHSNTQKETSVINRLDLHTSIETCCCKIISLFTRSNTEVSHTRCHVLHHT